MTTQNQAQAPRPARVPRAPRAAVRTAEHQPDSSEMEREPEREAAHTAPRARTRQRRSEINNDPYAVPLDEIPEGSSYEWKRLSNIGEENPFYIAEMRRQGWEPVDPKRHPNWVPPGYNLPTIVKGGLILMERPIELTKEAQAEQRVLSRRQMVEAEQRLGMTPKDTLTRQHTGVEPRVEKQMMRPVPIEE